MTAQSRNSQVHRRSPKWSPRTRADCEAFSAAVAGIDKELEQIFLSLPKLRLAVVLRHYELEYGYGAYTYAKRTYPRWKAGDVRLSGAVRGRLLNLVPMVMDPASKFDLVQKLRRAHLERKELYVSCSPSDWYQKVAPLVNGLVKRSNEFDLPLTVIELVKNWWRDEDAVAARQLLVAAEIDEAKNRLRYLSDEYRVIYHLLENVNGDIAVQHTIDLPQGTVRVVIDTATGFLEARSQAYKAEPFRGTLFVRCKNLKCSVELDTQCKVLNDETGICPPGAIRCPCCRATYSYDERDLYFVPVDLRVEIEIGLRGRYFVCYDCPNCFTRLKSPMQEAGTSDLCPKCQTKFLVPVPGDRRRGT